MIAASRLVIRLHARRVYGSCWTPARGLTAPATTGAQEGGQPAGGLGGLLFLRDVPAIERSAADRAVADLAPGGQHVVKMAHCAARPPQRQQGLGDEPPR